MQSVLAGYNHNIIHEGETFHVQTEDFGRNKAYFLTQVFLGGALVGKERHSYADLTQGDATDLPTDPIRRRMQAFHARAVRNVKQGAYRPQEPMPPPAPSHGPAAAKPMTAEDLEQMILKYFEPQVFSG